MPRKGTTLPPPPPVPKLTDVSPYRLHVARWSDCRACGLCQGRTGVVLARGTLPCDVLFCGEAPGECITGDTLVQTAFRDKSIYPDGIPVRDLVGKTDIKVYCVDDETGQLAIGDVERIWCTGIKTVYRVSYFWWGAPPSGKGGRQKYYGSIKVTANHPFRLKTGEYRSILQGLAVGNRLQPFYQRGIKRYQVGLHSGSMVKEAPFLLSHKLGRSLQEGEQAHHHDRNAINDSWDNLLVLDIVEHARLHGIEDNVMFDPVHKAKHKKAMGDPVYRKNMSQKLKAYLADPENRRKRTEQIRKQSRQTSETVKLKFANDPVFYYRYLRGMQNRLPSMTEERIKEKMLEKFPNESYPPSDENHTVYKIEKLGPAYVYDMRVPKYHNFAANGIIIHNSEDVLGRPFVGPAGKLLDEIVDRAWGRSSGVVGKRIYPVTWAFTNLVACIPRDENGGKATEPAEEYIEACQPRLVEMLSLAEPKLLGAVGKHATDWLTPGYRWSTPLPATVVKRVDLLHPAAILRANLTQRGLLAQRCVAQLREAAEEVFPEAFTREAV